MTRRIRLTHIKQKENMLLPTQPGGKQSSLISAGPMSGKKWRGLGGRKGIRSVEKTAKNHDMDNTKRKDLLRGRLESKAGARLPMTRVSLSSWSGVISWLQLGKVFGRELAAGGVERYKDWNSECWYNQGYRRRSGGYAGEEAY